MHPIFKKATAGVIILTTVSFYGFATNVEPPAPALDMDLARSVEVMGRPVVLAPLPARTDRFGELLCELSAGPAWSRGLAAQLLGDMGDGRAVDCLVASLATGDSWVATKAAEALGKIGSPRAVSPLIRALRTGDHTVRREAARALVRIGGAESRRALLAARSDPSPWVQHVIASARI